MTMPDKLKRAAFKLGSVDDHEDIPAQSDDAISEDPSSIHKSRKAKSNKRPKDLHIVHSKHNPHRHHQRAPSGGKSTSIAAYTAILTILVVLTEDGTQVSPLLPRTKSTTSLSKGRAKAVRNASESQLSKYHLRQTSEEEEQDEDVQDMEGSDFKSPEIITPVKESNNVDHKDAPADNVTKKLDSLNLNADTQDTIEFPKAITSEGTSTGSPEKIEFPKSKPRTKSPSPPMQKSQALPPQISTDYVESLPRSRPSSIYSVRRPPSLLSLTSIASDTRSPGRVRRLASTTSSAEPQLTQANAISSDLSTNRSLKSKFLEEGQTAATTLLRQQTGRKSSTTVQPQPLRMQQKLLLQRDEPDDRITTLESYGVGGGELEPEQQIRLIREIERVNREYAYISRYRDPMDESLQRCFITAGRPHKSVKAGH